MRCVPALVLRASSSVAQARIQLDGGPDGVDVVLVREAERGVSYYVFKARAVRDRLAASQPDADLASALQLSVYPPVAAVQIGRQARGGNVALEGRRVMGVFAYDTDDEIPRTTRGAQPTVVPRPPEPDGQHQPRYRGGGDPPPPGTAVPAGDAAGPPGLFRAYPDVTAPAEVGAGQTFTLDVGFAETPSSAMLFEGPPIMVVAGPQVRFVVQVTGFGFVFPDGIQRTLVVDRADPTRERVTFAVRADPTEAPAQRILEVSYEFQGAVVGRTQVLVSVAAAVPVVAPGPAPVGGTALVDAGPDRTPPHLSVDIFSEDGGSELRWVFHCRYPDIDRPTQQVTTSLRNHSAQSFARQIMQSIPHEPDKDLLAGTMRGIGRMVADVFPGEFWTLLGDTWRRARAEGDEPRMQITLTEPWIPWELALIESGRFEGAGDLLAADAERGAALGQLWQVARWTTPIRQLVTGDLPATPPATEVGAKNMAVIIGNYTETPGFGELPSAVEEGNTIAMTYGALPLDVSTAAVVALLTCRLERDSQPFTPTVLHFAGHGQTDVANPQFTGLILQNGRTLNPVTINGFDLVGRYQPFVFLNACEAGVAGETLMNLGGLVGAFLVSGARGFLAPLWQVDDDVARDIAVEFYEHTLGERATSVGEALRRLRRKYTPDSVSATPLAYVFYGNPDLRLQRERS